MDVLKSVLREGFWPRYCLEDVAWQGHVNLDFVAFPMVCFCDIPISRISEHVGFYGPFGLGLTKDWGAKNNLNPVMYFAGDNPVHAALKSLTSTVGNLEDEVKKTAGLRNVRYILAHSKPTSGRMIVSGEPVTKDFYQESEWRYVPRGNGFEDYLALKDFQRPEHLELQNANTGRLKFLPTDVRYIFVPKDSDIPEIMNFLQADLDRFPHADLKVLMARVTSLESMAVDV